MSLAAHACPAILTPFPYTPSRRAEHIRLKLQQHDLLRIYNNLEVGVRGHWLAPLVWLRVVRQAPARAGTAVQCCTLRHATHRACEGVHIHQDPLILPPPPTIPASALWSRTQAILSKPQVCELHSSTQLTRAWLAPCHPPQSQVIPSNFQMRGMHTIIRDRETKKNDFVFYVGVRQRCAVGVGCVCAAGGGMVVWLVCGLMCAAEGSTWVGGGQRLASLYLSTSSLLLFYSMPGCQAHSPAALAALICDVQ